MQGLGGMRGQSRSRRFDGDGEGGERGRQGGECPPLPCRADKPPGGDRMSMEDTTFRRSSRVSDGTCERTTSDSRKRSMGGTWRRTSNPPVGLDLRKWPQRRRASACTLASFPTAISSWLCEPKTETNGKVMDIMGIRIELFSTTKMIA